MRLPDNKTLVKASLWLSVAVVGVLSFSGAYMRRWIADDGLIVLRTVRNLQAGNGPVFNAGERVEANTSTLWQYLIWALSWTGLRLETLAMVLAIVLSVSAMMIGTWVACRFHSDGGRHSRPVPVAPAGALVYLALPPARDFFTSGLEWGLAIFWLAVAWAALVRFARPDDKAGITYFLAVWAGLSWLVRPELALYGGVIGLVLLVEADSWKVRGRILAVALPVPLGYQIFRMGYYGLLTPHTAVAKSASGSAWGHGFAYLGDFVGPYWLWLPLAILVGLSVYLTGGWQAPRLSPAASIRSRTGVTCILVACGLLHVLYVLRVGGDFMHGRMLLLPLFALLLPVFAVPLRDAWIAVAVGVIAVWSAVVAYRGHHVNWASFKDQISVVDEREYWTYATRREPGDGPKVVEDYANMRLMRGFVDHGIAGLEHGDAMSFMIASDDDGTDWITSPRDDKRTDPPTTFFMNMGMTSMLAPLDVRVLDPIGLATPIAARQPRMADGRIGHDKSLDINWQVADSAADIGKLPPWIDKYEVAKDRAALQAPDFQKLFATYRDPLDAKRFWENIKFSLSGGRTLALSANSDDYLR